MGTVLVILIIGVALAFLSSTTPDKPSVSIPYSSDRLILPMILAFCVAVLVVQYSSRSLWLGRAILVALLVSLGIASLDPFGVAMLGQIYDLPAEGKVDPIQTARSSVENLSISKADSRFVYLAIPVDVSGIPEGEALTPDDVRVSIDTAAGQHWTSSWQAINNQRLTAAEPANTFEVAIDKTFYDRIRSTPVTLNYRFAFTEIAPGTTNRVAFETDKPLAMPQVGLCSLGSDQARFTEFNCATPFHQPALAQLSAFESPLPCAPNQTTQPGWRLQSIWIGSALSPALSDLDFSPVQTVRAVLPNEWYQISEDEKPDRRGLCPGSPMAVRPFHLVRRFQSQLQVQNIQLPATISMM